MSDYRLGDDTPPISRRPSRVFCEDGGWYFTTREGHPMGPFQSKAEAEQGLQDFIEFIQLAPLEALVSLTDALTPEERAQQEGEGED